MRDSGKVEVYLGGGRSPNQARPVSNKRWRVGLSETTAHDVGPWNEGIAK